MTLLLGLDPVSFPQVSRSCIKYFFLYFIKRLTIPAVGLKQYARVIMFGIINALGTLQDNWLNNNHPLKVPLPSLYTIEIHRKGSEKYFTEFPGYYNVALSWHREFFPTYLTTYYPLWLCHPDDF